MEIVNRETPIYTPPTGPGELPPLSPEIYGEMGEKGIFAMLEAFYLALGDSEIRDLFPKDLVSASQKSAAFYVQLLGGPPLFNRTYGNPMMRRRHIPFEIDEAKRIVWLACFYSTLDSSDEKYNFPESHKESFKVWLDGFSKWMVNVAPS